MTQNRAEELADELQGLVLKRTGIKPMDLQCPREKSDTTPCVVRDGSLCAIVVHSRALCVGCEVDIQLMVDAERRRRNSPDIETSGTR